jgi:hypothetical protein
MMVDLNFRDRVLTNRFEAKLEIGDWEGRRISEGWAREQHFYFVLKLSGIQIPGKYSRVK